MYILKKNLIRCYHHSHLDSVTLKIDSFENKTVAGPLGYNVSFLIEKCMQYAVDSYMTFVPYYYLKNYHDININQRRSISAVYYPHKDSYRTFRFR